jgi:hypothetical protein
MFQCIVIKRPEDYECCILVGKTRLGKSRSPFQGTVPEFARKNCGKQYKYSAPSQLVISEEVFYY